MNQTQNVALDSCVVIDIMEKPKVASGLKASLRGKSVKIILCDILLREVRRVRGYLSEKVIAKLSKLLGRKIEVSNSSQSTFDNAQDISNQFAICHNGDNKILSLCQAKNFVLVTFDKMLLKTCQFLGVVAFHPKSAGGI
jgi:predicted nucleic acid-binding protein